MLTPENILSILINCLVCLSNSVVCDGFVPLSDSDRCILNNIIPPGSISLFYDNIKVSFFSLHRLIIRNVHKTEFTRLNNEIWQIWEYDTWTDSEVGKNFTKA